MSAQELHQQLLHAATGQDELTAVIRLHNPETTGTGEMICSECVTDGGCVGAENTPWPCPTIDAIVNPPASHPYVRLPPRTMTTEPVTITGTRIDLPHGPPPKGGSSVTPPRWTRHQ